MIISGMRVQRFGCLNDLTVNFMPGLNIIKGPNETGKSTLHQAILMALFERTSKKRSNEVWRAWGSDRLYQMALHFSIDGRGNWDLAKDFEENTVRLSNDLGETYRTYDTVQDQIDQFLGTSDMAIFTSTACVAQDALSDMAGGRKGIVHQLETIVTGGSEDANTLEVLQKVTAAIKHHRRGYQTTAYANPGPIARLVGQQAELQAATEQLRQQNEQFVLNIERKQELAEQLAEVEAELTPRLQIQAMANEFQELNEQFRTLQRAETELDNLIERIEEAQKDLSLAESELAVPDAIISLSETDLQSMEQAHTRIEYLSEHPPAPPVPAAGNAPTMRRTLMWPLVLFVLGILGTLASLAAYDSAPDLQNALLLGLAASLLLAVVAGMWTIVAASHRSQPATRTTTAPARSILREFPELANLQYELDQRLSKLGCQDWDDFVGKRSAVEAAKRARDRARTQLEVLAPDEKSKFDLEAERQQAVRKRRDVEERLDTPEMKRLAQLSPVALTKLAQEIQGFQTKKEELTAKLMQLTYAIAAATDRSEELLAAEERLIALQTEIERQIELLNTYELTLQTLEAAREHTLVRARDRLAPRMATYLNTLTGGRYQQVEVSSDLSIAVWSSQANSGTVTPDQLSRGTRDQLYFAARLALVDLLFGDAKPPIFLDDPFVTFDPVRRQAAIGLCRTIALDRQVFLFTCASVYDSYGHTIELERVRSGTGSSQIPPPSTTDNYER